MPSRLAASEQGCNRYISFSFDLAASAAWDVTQIDGIAGFISLGRHPDRWNRRLHQPANGLGLLQPRHHPGRGLRLRPDRRRLRDLREEAEDE
ncbi:MAG: hypothetical protein JRG95_09815 [Deltaproteobacteria bacterium]|nr:hypothetical protein [Deltaproteobacteria bacterium]